MVQTYLDDGLLYEKAEEPTENDSDGSPTRSRLSWMTRRCRAKGTFGVTCKGRMEYQPAQMRFICLDCGNTEGIL